MLCGPRRPNCPVTDEQSAGPGSCRNRSLQNKDIRTKQAFQMTDGCPGPGRRPAGSSQQFRARAGTEDAPRPGPRLASVVHLSSRCRGMADSAPGGAGQVPGRPSQGRPQTVPLHPGRRGGQQLPQMGLWEEGRCLPTPQIMALGHWEEVGQKGIKAVYMTRGGSRPSLVGMSFLSRLPPRDRPEVTG